MRHYGAMPHQFVNVAMAAAILGVHRSTVHRRISRGDITPIGWVGRSPLLDRADVDALKRGEQHLPAKEPAA